MDRITVEVCRTLLELRKILYRTQTALGTMDLLMRYTPQARGIEPEAPLLGPGIGIQVELRGSMPVDVAVQTGDAQAGVRALAVIGGIELLLRQWGEQQA